MPMVEQWWLEELKRFDPELTIEWVQKLQRYRVSRKLRNGTFSTVMIIQDRNGHFLRPHPKLIIFGDDELGIRGLIYRDMWRHRLGPKYWIDDLEEREKKGKEKSEAGLRETVHDHVVEVAKEMKPKIYTEVPWNKEEGCIKA